MMPGRKWFQDVLTEIAAFSLLPHRFRPALLRRAGASVGDNVLMYGGSTYHSQMRLTIDDDVFVNQSCHFDMQAPIRIEKGVRIGNHVRFVTSDHEVGPSDRRAGPGRSEAITIGRGTWICSGATILPGVSVAEGNIIAAGAVVTRSTEANCLYAGVPARVIKRLDQEVSAP